MPDTMKNTDAYLGGYRLIRSERKTLAIQIKTDGTVVVRAPKKMCTADIERFITEKQGWIQKHRKEYTILPKLCEAQLDALRRDAERDIPTRVAFFADKLQVSYGSVTIRRQRTRWGSCSARGNLSFNCLLMLAPDSVREYVVIHELCHRLEMNHSAAFWEQVAGIMPDYALQRRWLKNHGPELIGRLPDKDESKVN